MVHDQIAGRGIRDKRLLAAMNDIPRHMFMDQTLWRRAYEDHPLPIGNGQTISQPYMVALMTDAMGLTGSEKVLEIGTGSGYQTAILAKLADWVFSLERLSELSRAAQRVLEELKLYNVNLIVGDGTKGWPEEAPYDAIIVTAGAPVTPGPLVEQLAEGGRLLVPVGDRGIQTLLRISKRDGRVIEEDLGGCRFVDLIGEHGW
ncbi:MAG: protein-L-isoaspartate(D-aspartate) O-methyltransferase [Desulfarculaceae bacterium]|nr:protein-L-isoaspartate(D-aspartate) O-methyltransferase [Desulfarculaceae bacterium]MCF8072739.1 protein-L-isoaspartate(D-aspartate) O-methyltransferase [Desulfarculaceae bacterium]MCF8103027.1 protein-L-isoaspartate(D-aspartate) O-methyltransferase [Desulfarculaceae bacterium]MCF8118108.1 protein-L-isoaspartate(D-aspartate) O-methyltransferase [Desulfarculaceae bacterium]